MFESIEPLDVYNKNINILIGSGASADLFPTLGLAIKNAKDEWETVEKLATSYENWTSPGSVDKSQPHAEARSKASGLTPPR